MRFISLLHVTTCCSALTAVAKLIAEMHLAFCHYHSGVKFASFILPTSESMKLIRNLEQILLR